MPSLKQKVAASVSNYLLNQPPSANHADGLCRKLVIHTLNGHANVKKTLTPEELDRDTFRNEIFSLPSQMYNVFQLMTYCNCGEMFKDMEEFEDVIDIYRECGEMDKDMEEFENVEHDDWIVIDDE